MTLSYQYWDKKIIFETMSLVILCHNHTFKYSMSKRILNVKEKVLNGHQSTNVSFINLK